VAAKGDRLREHAFIGHCVPRRVRMPCRGHDYTYGCADGRNENGPPSGPRIEALAERREGDVSRAPKRNWVR
jgi:hypothetical protein